jgi:hypothetical protein
MQKKQCRGRKARPLADVLLSCHHWESFTYIPELNAVVWCIRCREERQVIEHASYIAMCDQCDWNGKHGSQFKIAVQAKNHALENRHCARMLRSDLELQIFDYIGQQQDQIMLDSA